MVFLGLCLVMLGPVHGQIVPPAESGKTQWSPARKPTSVGAVNVGMIPILFPDTALDGGIPQFKRELDNINGLTQEEYFKIYTNGITWPVVKIVPGENVGDIFLAPQFYGYYCKYDLWHNPIGWKSMEEGQMRASQLKADALNAAKAKLGGMGCRRVAFSFITTPFADPARRPDMRRYYAEHCGMKPEDYPDPVAIPVNLAGPIRSAKPAAERMPTRKPPELMMGDEVFDPWKWYRPSVNWGEPMWPNSSIQIQNAEARVFAHEYGHVLGAPDVYRVYRSNDGIGGAAALLTYGPTASALSRYYHHGFVEEKNYPMVTQPGTYTLHPRHIKPMKDEAIGFVIPSRHSHYFYHVEYIHGEHAALGQSGGREGQKPERGEYAGNTAGVEGVIISVVNIRVQSYQGSPDLFYTYRPNDPYFRGDGNLHDCLFGIKFQRVEFSMTTEPSSRLPNLVDGGVAIKSIKERQGTATFDLEINTKPLLPRDYQQSLLPQIKLDSVDQILPTSFRMAATCKFRGEPLVTRYGMCWSTAKKPTVAKDKLVFAHGEIYQGRALNLKPDTKYFVRAWSANAKGIRYSDEEIEVKTLPLAANIHEVSPLLLDGFSKNQMLRRLFANNAKDRYGDKINGYESYAPVGVLGKLVAYYRPENLEVPRDGMADKANRRFDFGLLHWSPFESDPDSRKAETHALFGELRRVTRVAKMHEVSLGIEFQRELERIVRQNPRPQLMRVKAENVEEALEFIQRELRNSRPVMVIESPTPKPDSNKRIQWGLIDGFRDVDKLHVDFPLDTEFLASDEGFVDYMTLKSLLVKDYDLFVFLALAPDRLR